MADILVIEDNLDNMLMMKRWLSSMNCNTQEALTGMAGIAAAHKNLPSIILLDINLPDIDGYEVISNLKSSADTKNIPVIAITSNAMQGDEDKAKRAGFDDYMSKPVNFSSLISKMSSLGVYVSYKS
jgi:two-component system, cell cycle response regulator DivK